MHAKHGQQVRSSGHCGKSGSWELIINILILGGTGFIGSHIVNVCLNQKHKVSVFSRGLLKSKYANEVINYFGDRNSGQDAFKQIAGEWDVCIDLSGYTPLQVDASVSYFYEKIKHYVYFSAIRVFKPCSDFELHEDSEKFEIDETGDTEINNESYGKLKARCESLVKEKFAEKATIIRPQVVVGPEDKTGRLAYWILKSKCSSTALLPGNGADYLQLIDVRDLASFVLKVIEKKIFGEFNLSGHRITWYEFCDKIKFTKACWVDIANEELSFRELPLYRKLGTPEASYMNVCNQKAKQFGLELRDIDFTLKDFELWMQKNDIEKCVPSEIRNEWLTISKEQSIIEKIN